MKERIIQTVMGPMALDGLGFCQPHEHVYVEQGPATLANPSLLIDDAERSARELIAYREAGGCSIIDAQPGGAGRNARVLSQLAICSHVHIIAVTGYHLPMFYRPEHWALHEDEETLFGRFCDELANGCEEAPTVRPGAVKAALSAEGCAGALLPRFRAAARAAAQADVPLILHTEKGAGACEAARLARELGLKPERLLVCHADRQAADFAPHEAIAATGAMLEYDTVSRFKYHDDEAEIRLIRHMLERGYAAQLLISLDTTRERLENYGGAIGLTRILNVFLPALRRSGVSESDIRTITLDNPRKIFA